MQQRTQLGHEWLRGNDDDAKGTKGGEREREREREREERRERWGERRKRARTCHWIPILRAREKGILSG